MKMMLTVWLLYLVSKRIAIFPLILILKPVLEGRCAAILFSKLLYHVLAAMDERLGSYALIARAAVDATVPFLTKLFSDRVARLHQVLLIDLLLEYSESHISSSTKHTCWPIFSYPDF